MNERYNTLTELLNIMPAEIDEYNLSIGKYYDPEWEQICYTFTYENPVNGTIIRGCDFNDPDPEVAARQLVDWLVEHGHIQLQTNREVFNRMLGDPVTEFNNIVKSVYGK